LVWDPVDPELELGRVEKKIREEKTRRDQLTRRPGQDPVANPLTFISLLFFLLKRRRFDFFFKKKN
jgi:hypothetical protein